LTYGFAYVNAKARTFWAFTVENFNASEKFGCMIVHGSGGMAVRFPS
jgi:hypothetical protein